MNEINSILDVAKERDGEPWNRAEEIILNVAEK